jgi:L-rhamnose mutarotase
MRRICFQLNVRPELIAEYTARHAAVWPDLLQALAETGWHNYSLFLRPDGLLIGYFETPSLRDALAGMANLRVNTEWQAEMSKYFVELDDLPPDQAFVQVDEIFHLEDQLAGLAVEQSSDANEK